MSGDRVHEVYTGKLFSENTQKELRDRVHWICSQVVGPRVLDIGCSQGTIPLLLAREKYHVLGIDPDSDAIGYARELLSKEEKTVRDRVHLTEASAIDYVFDEKFNTVILGQVLEHLVRPDLMVETAHSVLEEGGRIIVTTPFGLFPHGDHKQTFYLSGFLEILAPYFSSSDLKVLGKRICFSGDRIKSDPSRHFSSLISAGELIQLAEELFEENEERLYEDKRRLTERLNDQETRLQNLRSREVGFETNIKALAAENDRLASELDAALNRGKELQEQADEAARLHSEKSVLRQELDETKSKLEASRAEISAKHRESERAKLLLESERRDLKAQIENREAELERSRSSLEESRALVRTLRTSTRWKLGTYFAEAARPSRDTLLLPFRLARLVFTSRSKRDPARKVITKTGLEPPDPQKLSVAAILDTFSRACFEPEADLVTFRPDNWKKFVTPGSCRLLFVESAWSGNDGAWQYKVGQYPRDMGDELGDLVRFCRDNGIPTAFWNKEDPVHFDRFIKRASLFDTVFTTDKNCIPRYIAALGHERVYALPFAAQPRIHNPIQHETREGTVCFAGTYYANRHDQRRKDMDYLLKPCLDFGLEIFDRRYGYAGPNAEHYQFPEVYQSAIRGRLEYGEMIKAYKRYRCFLNVNSVKDSDTMFSRRVFELLASGTPVISTYSAGIASILGDDTVLFTDSEETTREHLSRLLEDQEFWVKTSVRGLRNVFRGNTYADRFRFLKEKAGTPDLTVAPAVVAVVVAHTPADLEDALASVSRQTVPPKQIVILAEEPPNSADLARGGFEGGQLSFYPATKPGFQAFLREFSRNDLDLVAFIRPGAGYSENYFEEFLHASNYAPVDILGRHTFFHSDDGETLKLTNPGSEFKLVSGVPSASVCVKSKRLDLAILERVANRNWFRSAGRDILSLHRFGFVETNAGPRTDLVGLIELSDFQ
jgi:2-polyprenyl-3-methyl-5-hydroxy-6-metoxy-1,4-benzoquinol methylase/glycosyltransferase involved in cell wall biosynthesis